MEERSPLFYLVPNQSSTWLHNIDSLTREYLPVFSGRNDVVHNLFYRMNMKANLQMEEGNPLFLPHPSTFKCLLVYSSKRATYETYDLEEQNDILSFLFGPITGRWKGRFFF